MKFDGTSESAPHCIRSFLPDVAEILCFFTSTPEKFTKHKNRIGFFKKLKKGLVSKFIFFNFLGGKFNFFLILSFQEGVKKENMQFSKLRLTKHL